MELLKILLTLVLFVACPLVGLAVRGCRRLIAGLVLVIGFLPLYGDVSFSLMVVLDYRGTDIGFRVALIDVLACVLYVATVGPRTPPAPYRALRYAYFGACVFATIIAPSPLYAAFSLWTLLRCHLLVTALSSALEDRRLLRPLLWGMACGLLYMLGIAIQQRYFIGLHQAPSTFAHQNSAGMAAYLAGTLMIPGVLAARGDRLGLAAVLAGCLVVVLSLSRGCLTMLPLAIGITYLGSVLLRPTIRKLLMGAMGALIGFAILARCIATIEDRFETAPESSAAGRVAYNAMAMRMVADHPLGIGLNQFSSRSGEYCAIGAEEVGMPVDGGAVVHNAYLLAAAELGVAGGLIYLALVIQPLVVSLAAAWRFRRDERSELLIACFAGLLAFSLQGTLEWVARQDRNLAIYWMVCVVAAVVRRQLEEDRRARAGRPILVRGLHCSMSGETSRSNGGAV